MRQFIGLLFFLLFFSTSAMAESYHSARYKMNFDVPPGWDLVDTTRGKSVLLLPKYVTATVNVTAYYFEEPVTVNEFQLFRMGGHFDGWMNLFQREGTSEEIAKSQAVEASVAVYGKHELDASMQVSKRMVGEYYFINDHNAYVISIHASQKDWPSLQKDVKAIRDSFWIGEGERPALVIPDKVGLNWPMIGGDSQNTGYLDAFHSRQVVMSEQWSQLLSEFEAHHSISMVVDSGVAIVSVGSRLLCVSVETGEVVWQFDLDFDIVKHLALADGVLFVTSVGESSEILALNSDDGSVLYRLNVQSQLSELVTHENQLFFVEKGDLVSHAVDTGALKWRKSLNLDEQYYPVVTKEVVLVAQEKRLYAVARDTGRLLWRKSIQSLRFTPLIRGNSLLAILESKKGDQVVSYDLEMGDVQWQWVPETPVVFLNGLSADHHMMVGNIVSQDEEYLIGLRRDGELEWKMGAIDVLNRPILANDYAFVSSSGKMVVYDIGTGESLGIKQSNRKALRVGLQFRLYQDRVLKVGVDGKNITLSCDK